MSVLYIQRSYFTDNVGASEPTAYIVFYTVNQDALGMDDPPYSTFFNLDPSKTPGTIDPQGIEYVLTLEDGLALTDAVGIPGTMEIANTLNGNIYDSYVLINIDTQVYLSLLDKQDASSSLDALSGLTGSAGYVPYFTGTSTMNSFQTSSFVRGIMNTASQAAMQTSLGIANPDWNATTGLTQILNKPTLATVATSGAYSDLTGKPTIPTVPTTVSSFTNDSGYLTSAPVSSVAGRTGAITLSTTDVSGYVAPVNADWNASTGLSKINNKPTIPTAVSSLTNDSGYITTSALSSYVTSSSLTTTLGSYATSSALTSGLSGKQATITTGSSSQYFKGDLTLGTFPTINNTTVYSGTTAKANPVFYTGSVTVGSGVAVFNITSDGTSTGTALFPNGPISSSLNFYVNDATAAYQMSAAWSNSNKTLTITANKLTTANILSGILGQSAANGAVVNVSVWGN